MPDHRRFIAAAILVAACAGSAAAADREVLAELVRRHRTAESIDLPWLVRVDPERLGMLQPMCDVGASPPALDSREPQKPRADPRRGRCGWCSAWWPSLSIPESAKPGLVILALAVTMPRRPDAPRAFAGPFASLFQFAKSPLQLSEMRSNARNPRNGFSRDGWGSSRVPCGVPRPRGDILTAEPAAPASSGRFAACYVRYGRRAGHRSAHPQGGLIHLRRASRTVKSGVAQSDPLLGRSDQNTGATGPTTRAMQTQLRAAKGPPGCRLPHP